MHFFRHSRKCQSSVSLSRMSCRFCASRAGASVACRFCAVRPCSSGPHRWFRTSRPRSGGRLRCRTRNRPMRLRPRGHLTMCFWCRPCSIHMVSLPMSNYMTDWRRRRFIDDCGVDVRRLGIHGWRCRLDIGRLAICRHVCGLYHICGMSGTVVAASSATCREGREDCRCCE